MPVVHGLVGLVARRQGSEREADRMLNGRGCNIDVSYIYICVIQIYTCIHVYIDICVYICIYLIHIQIHVYKVISDVIT